ncbi:hypothetical protein TSOC_009121 [Tetrabaena socialis]|uniref:BACK domain-containing protein n=1 Tax=Tetrabaena socialis TaxID=47790 RepID=A0A2J7ZWP1_9CHLO|nr:hypothetical protein TSOC_009121 [Tetrabaena socialis]|eukprot:PNH04672.1 hypothetical protein TSOC_009121 [Tetrabaena socialis]
MSAGPEIVHALAGLFETGQDADCDVALCLEESSKKGQGKRPKTAPAAGAVVLLLPGHLLILRLSSERFRAQLRVPLGSEAEAPFARAAIGYAYTGRVAADCVRAALELRRQAAYLQINGCAAACDKLLANLLAAASSSEPGIGAGGGEQAAAAAATPAGGASPSSPSPPAIEFMSCWPLLPDPAEEPTFAPVLAAAKEALVRHFGDALAALNTPSLRQQLLQLPAAAVEALLGSDVFGTDCEESVLLMLATWMKANYAQTDAATRERLCRLVRLVQLGRPYLTAVLPALAADHLAGGAKSPGAWFPISVAEAGFIAALAAAPAGPEKEALLSLGGKVYDTQSPRYGMAARSQCLSGAGRGYEWAISQQELLEVLGKVQPGGGFVSSGTRGVFSGAAESYVCARGFAWQMCFHIQHAATSAGLYLQGYLPVAYDVRGSQLGSSSEAFAVVGLNASLVLHSWTSGTRRDAFKGSFVAAQVVHAVGPQPIRLGWGWASALPLAQPQPAAGSDHEALAGWAAHLHEGQVTGTLTLPPP